MDKLKHFAAGLLAMLLFFVLVGGTISAQVILWKTSWYIALMHLVLVGFAASDAYRTVRNLVEYSVH